MKTLNWILIMLLCTACAKPYRGFVLDGKIAGTTSDIMVLNYLDSLGQNRTDTVAVENGCFRFRGGIKEPTPAMLSNGKPIRSSGDRHYVNLWLEPGAMRYEAAGNDLQLYTLAGSETDADAQELNERLAPLVEQLKALQAPSGVDAERLFWLRDSLGNAYKRIQLDFVVNRPDSYITPGLMRMFVIEMNPDELQAYYDRWTEEVKQSPAGKEIAGEIRKLRAGSPGAVAPLFAGTDVNGKEFRLADLRGKYVLLDFWATWCKPCRASNPHLKALFKKYHVKGLEVVCVADDDGNAVRWREAVEEDEIGEFHHVLRGLKRLKDGYDKSGDIHGMYGIHTLPTKFLIDREGIIVGRYGGGGSEEEKMDADLKKAFGF